MESFPKSTKFKLFSPLIAKILLSIVLIWAVLLFAFQLYLGAYSLAPYTFIYENIFLPNKLLFILWFALIDIAILITVFSLWKNQFRTKLAQQTMIITLSIVLAFSFNCLSVFIITSYQAPYGNQCDTNPDRRCYAPAPQAGFPFAYLQKSDTSVNATMSLLHHSFIFNLGIYFIILYSLLYFHSKSINKVKRLQETSV